MKRLLALLLFLSGPLAAATPVWQPAKTWVFAVGVLRFDDPKLTTWPDEGRADADLMRALRKRGVPAERIVFLKNERATRRNIERSFAPFLRRAGSDDTLFFYYAGHGGRDYSDRARTCTLLTYDTASSWTVSSVFDTVEKNFPGRQVIYTADCCHSGSLVAEASRRGSAAAVLASAHVSSTSTGNWTFTRCLVDLIEGHPLFDLDGDGKVTFAEGAGRIRQEMAFFEGQHSADGTRGGFSPDTVMSLPSGAHTPRMGTWIEGESQGRWWKAEVLVEKPGRVFVTWPGWGREYDEWLPLERTRPFRPKTWSAGDAVQTEWRGRWYDARVLKVELGLHLVHYEGFPESDDEWVALARLRPRPSR